MAVFCEWELSACGGARSSFTNSCSSAMASVWFVVGEYEWRLCSVWASVLEEVLWVGWSSCECG